MRASIDSVPMTFWQRRGLTIGVCWALGVGTIAVALGGSDGRILYSQSKTLMFVAAPALLLLVSPLLALKRRTMFLAAMPLLALVIVEIGFGVVNDGRSNRSKRGESRAASVAEPGATPAEEIDPWVEARRWLGEPRVVRSRDQSGKKIYPWADIRRLMERSPRQGFAHRFDSFGRRITPDAGIDYPTKAALFLGGSHVMGRRIRDDETLPAAFSRHSPRYRSYNYGYQGLGASQLLDIVRERDFRREIELEVDLAFYLVTSRDIPRTIGSMREAIRMCQTCSNYELNNSGVPVRNGDFSTGRPARTVLYHLLDRSEIIEYLRADVPWDFSPRHYRLVAAVLREIRDTLRATYPKITFHVLISPGAKLARPAGQYAEELGLSVMDTHDVYDKKDNAMRVSARDSHPSALANDLMAKRIVAELNRRQETSGVLP